MPLLPLDLGRKKNHFRGAVANVRFAPGLRFRSSPNH